MDIGSLIRGAAGVLLAAVCLAYGVAGHKDEKGVEERLRNVFDRHLPFLFFLVTILTDLLERSLDASQVRWSLAQPFRQS
jgi:hypothetical protein